MRPVALRSSTWVPAASLASWEPAPLQLVRGLAELVSFALLFFSDRGTQGCDVGESPSKQDKRSHCWLSHLFSLCLPGLLTRGLLRCLPIFGES